MYYSVMLSSVYLIRKAIVHYGMFLQVQVDSEKKFYLLLFIQEYQHLRAMQAILSITVRCSQKN